MFDVVFEEEDEEEEEEFVDLFDFEGFKADPWWEWECGWEWLFWREEGGGEFEEIEEGDEEGFNFELKDFDLDIEEWVWVWVWWFGWVWWEWRVILVVSVLVLLIFKARDFLLSSNELMILEERDDEE